MPVLYCFVIIIFFWMEVSLNLCFWRNFNLNHNIMDVTLYIRCMCVAIMETLHIPLNFISQQSMSFNCFISFNKNCFFFYSFLPIHIIWLYHSWNCSNVLFYWKHQTVISIFLYWKKTYRKSIVLHKSEPLKCFLNND